MNKFLSLSYLLFLSAISITLMSCSSDNDNENSSTEIDFKKKLIGTSWYTQCEIWYDYNNKELARFDKSYDPHTITFTNKKFDTNSDNLTCYVELPSAFSQYQKAYTMVRPWNVIGNKLEADGPTVFGEILGISDTELRTKDMVNLEEEWYRIEVYTRTAEPDHYFESDYEGGSSSNTDDNTGGGSTTYEKPEIGFYDFTATKTSLNVQYKIYNKDEAKVSSAKIYYGTSSNPSSSRTATISGTLITANISGLKAGTTYYVKCAATGKGGTTTTSTTRCITNY